MAPTENEEPRPRTETVQLFALARDLAAAESIPVRLAAEATVGDLRRAIEEQYPALQFLVPRAMIAVNAEYAADEEPLPACAEIACIPPVSGG